MNTSMQIKTQPFGWNKIMSGLLAGSLWLSLTGCSTTKQVSETPKDFSGFLGDYSMLKKGSGEEANYIYIDQSADWAKYTKVYVQNVEIWKSDAKDSAMGKMSKDDQQMLASFYQTAIANSLGKNFQVVNQAGPDTLVIRVALTEGKGSWPVLNLVSSVYPATLVLSYVKQAFTGTGSFVGKVKAEADFTDGVTGQRVAAAVDERAGTKAWRTKFGGSWGDVKLCADWWAARIDERLLLLKKGDFSDASL